MSTTDPATGNFPLAAESREALEAATRGVAAAEAPAEARQASTSSKP